MITQTELKNLLKYDPDTGVFTNRVDRCYNARAGEKAGSFGHGYLQIRIKSKLYNAHRLVWLYIHGHHPTEDIDHINGNRSDNRLCNLRACSRSDNIRNQKLRLNSKSGLKGVTWYKRDKKWRAAIGFSGKQIHLGCFNDKLKAAKAYDTAAIKHFGEFALTNKSMGLL